jgi:hypothetical protein
MSRTDERLREAMLLFTDAIDRQSELLRALAEPELERRRRGQDRALAVAADPRPRRMTFWTIARSIPGLAELFDTVVPANLWALVDDGEAELPCPCGEAIHLPAGRPVECSCGRFFVFDGDEIRVAFSPAARR